MSEVTDTEETQTEIAALKVIADNMEIPYKPNIGVKTLKDKIELARSASEAKTVGGSKNARAKLVSDATRLVRVQVQCLRPDRKEYRGEFVTVSNNLIGSETKFVQYGRPWMISNFMMKVLKGRKHRNSYEVTDQVTGRKRRVNEFVDSYQVTILDDLTEEELKELADDQRKREFNRDA